MKEGERQRENGVYLKMCYINFDSSLYDICDIKYHNFYYIPVLYTQGGKLSCFRVEPHNENSLRI